MSSTNYDCAVCLTECDSDHETPIILEGEKVCPECRQWCDGNCGEYLTDDSIRIGGPIVRFRDWVVSGKLRHSHASCAAETLLTYFDRKFDYDHSTREEITAAVELHMAQAIVMQQHEQAQCVPAANGWFQIVSRVPYSKADVIGDGRTSREAWMCASEAVRAVPA